MVRWHHRLDEHEFEQTPGDGEGQACCTQGVTKSPTRLSDSEKSAIRNLWLMTTEINSLTLRRPDVQNQSVSRAMPPLLQERTLP